MWDAKCEQLEHEIEILEYFQKQSADQGISFQNVESKIGDLKQQLKDLAVRIHHQA
jgi:hypothetical protein